MTKTTPRRIMFIEITSELVNPNIQTSNQAIPDKISMKIIAAKLSKQPLPVELLAKFPFPFVTKRLNKNKTPIIINKIPIFLKKLKSRKAGAIGFRILAFFFLRSTFNAVNEFDICFLITSFFN